MSNPSQWPDDEELLDRSRRGDQTAFRMLVERYEQQVAASVISMVGAGDAADDIGQETFVRFYRALEKFRGDAALGTYLTRIAMNLCLNELKRRKRRRLFFLEQSVEEFAQDVHLAEEDASAEQRSDVEFVHKALSYLKPEFRSVIVLRLIQGYSTQETAEILGIPTGTVLSRLSRGQEKLRDVVENLEGEDVSR